MLFTVRALLMGNNSIIVPREGGVKWEVRSAVRNSRVSGGYFVLADAICTFGTALPPLDQSPYICLRILSRF